MESQGPDEIDDVFDVITEFYGVSLADVLSPRRSSQVHNARCVGIYLAYKTGRDPEEIGKRFRRNPHVINAVSRNMERKSASEIYFSQLIRDLDVIRRIATQRRRLIDHGYFH